MSLKSLALQKCFQAEAFLEQARKTPEDRTLIPSAIALYQEVFALDIELAEPYLGVALLSFSAGNKANALAALKRAELIDPTNGRVWQLRHRMEKKHAPSVSVSQGKETVQNVRSLQKPNAEKPSRLNAQQEIPAPKSSPQPKPKPPPVLVLGPDPTCHCTEGPQVLALQESLKTLGFRKVQISGSYDPPTLNAIQTFQMKHKLKITGHVTEALLNRLLKMAQKKGPLKAAVDLPLGPAGTKNVVSKGKAVEHLQDELRLLNYDVTVHGRFDTQTTQAVKDLQRNNKIQPHGKVDAETRRALHKALEAHALTEENTQEILSKLLACEYLAPISELAQSHLKRFCARLWEQIAAMPSHQGVPYESETPVLVAPLTEVLGSQGQTGVTCSQGEPVVYLQEVLNQEGESLKASGLFDLDTFMALKAFQKRKGLPESGMTDPATCELLNPLLLKHLSLKKLSQDIQQAFIDDCLAKGRNVPEQVAVWSQQLIALAQGAAFDQVLKTVLPHAITSELGPQKKPGQTHRGPQVELLQLRLTELGEELAVSGVYDSSTTAAVRRFQTRQKLPMTGVVNRATAEALGLTT